ncbi:hypothetical protein FKM82_005913 [Ascaphus truei]
MQWTPRSEGSRTSEDALRSPRKPSSHPDTHFLRIPEGKLWSYQTKFVYMVFPNDTAVEKKFAAFSMHTLPVQILHHLWLRSRPVFFLNH